MKTIIMIMMMMVVMMIIFLKKHQDHIAHTKQLILFCLDFHLSDDCRYPLSFLT